MQSDAARHEEIARLEGEVTVAAQAGRNDLLLPLFTRILGIDPNHLATLTALGKYAFRNEDLGSALTAFKRIVDVDGRDPQQWVNLALVHRSRKDESAEEAAIKGALTADPSDLLALVLRANLLERQGKMHRAAGAYAAVATVAGPLERLHPDLRPAVLQAIGFKENYDLKFGAFLDDYLSGQYEQHNGENLKRFADAVDIMVGRKRRYDAQPALFYYPNLPQIEFFDRALFPWLDQIEAATDAIREEFLNVLQREEGFAPYITYPPDAPVNQWAELNNSPQWSAFHLYKDGSLLQDNAAKCPLTMSLLAQVPQPVQAGRTPAAMFSLLKPKTRIPPHTGVSNVRLVTHVPLIIPPGCGFRVGNDVREWIPGKAWVFDDTINHEAWNDSDKLRVVLIFDIWHPHLSEAERAMITALAVGMNQFSSDSTGFEL